MNSVYHIMVLWSKALEHKDFVVRDLQNSGFSIYRMFNVHWNKENFLDDYTVFYAHSQKHLPYDQYRSLLAGKIEHCGDGNFLAIILRDDDPVFEKRQTSSGKRLVNTRVFDKKAQYRELCGGGHKVHSSDDAWETNKDLTLMFGLNTEDFLKKYESSDVVGEYEHECVGVGGYKSIYELFYVLNNTVEYVVLRNFECLPDEYTVEGHGDIDLLVEDKNYVRYLTIAKPVFEEDYRVYHEIKIGGCAVPFDFRFIGDNYYDKPWECDVLKNRVMRKSLFYTPDDANLFYTLLYHAYVQKWNVKADYIPKLEGLSRNVGVKYIDEAFAAINLLDTYLFGHGYEYIRPKDKTVVYNEEHLKLSDYALRYGDFIKREDEFGDNGFVYQSYVYEKPDSFVKRGSKWIIENELKYLRQLQSYEGFPKVISVEDDEIGMRMEISRVKGVCFKDFFKDVNHQRKSYVISFIEQCLGILHILNEQSIVHRDFIPQNIMIADVDGRCAVGLIDFGWAVSYKDDKVPCPLSLGGHYYSSQNKSDLYALGSILLEYWYDVRYVRNVANVLRNAKDISKGDNIAVLKKARKKSHACLLVNDELRLFLRRHQRPRMIIDSLKCKIRKYLNK